MTNNTRRAGQQAALHPTTKLRTKGAIAALLWAALAMAPAAAAQMSCKASAEPRQLRYYGAAELLADLRLDCTGGRAPAPGESAPEYQIVVSADAPLTMRSVAADPLESIQWTEALLLLDDPAPRNQRPCVPDAETIEESPGSLDCGANEGRANVFQGLRLQENAVVFQQTPIAPPGPNQTRTLRIVNLRADVRELTPEPDPDGVLDPEPAAQVSLTVRIFGPGGEIVPVEQADQLVGALVPDVEVDVRTAANEPVPKTEPAVLSTPGLTPQGRPEEGPTFLIQFTELSPDVFRRRNIGSNGLDPTFLTSQATPGVNAHTESGLFNAAFPNRRGWNQAGLADAGTRLRVVMDDVPPGIRVWLSYREVELGTTGYDADVPRARLTAPEGGAFRPQLPEIGEFIEVWPSNGHAEVLWEITSSDPQVIETLSFAVGMTGPNGDVDLGDATLVGYLAPGYESQDDEAPDEDSVTITTTIPSFDISAKMLEPRPAFSVVPSLPTSEVVSVSAASYMPAPVAPGSIVAGFGVELAEETRAAFGVPGPRLGKSRVDVIDSAGGLRPATLFAISPGQVNFLLDPNTRLGPAIVRVFEENRPLAEGSLQVSSVAPGLFGANGDGRGPAAGQWLRAGVAKPLAEPDPATGGYAAAAVDVASGDVYLALYGTGFRRADLADVELRVGGVVVPVSFLGQQPEYLGLDQINAGPLPASLAGRGLADIVVRIGQSESNRVRILLR